MLNSGSGIRLGRVLGFPVFVDGTLLLIIGFFVLWELQSGLAAVGASAIFFGVVVASIIMHELGHALMVRHLDLGESSILLSGLGGVTLFQRTPSPRKGILVALAGPGVGLLIGGLSLPIWWMWGASLPRLLGYGLETLWLVNLVFNAANLLPIFPLDGGQVLRYILQIRTSSRRALTVTAAVGITLVAVCAAALFAHSGFDSIFLWLILAIMAAENVRLYRRAQS